MKHSLLVGLGFCFFATASLAHGPTPQKVAEKISINAAPAAVWAIAGDYAGIAKWNSELKASTGDNKKRVLIFKNGEKLEEEVDEYDTARMTYSYRMINENLKALPASSYSATLVVTPGNQGGSQVEWTAHVYRGETENDPPEELNDEAAKKALTKLFRAGLDGIKAKVEGVRGKAGATD